jgi:HK97 gp10 family phage protein
MTVAVDTGALKESGWITYEEGLITVGYGPGVSGDVDYAIYVELGTYKMAAQPFLVPAFVDACAKIEADLQALFIT